RAARPALEHARGRQAHRARQRGRGARAPLPSAPGAEPHLQPDTDRGGGGHLLPDAVARGAALEPTGEPRAGRAVADAAASPPTGALCRMVWPATARTERSTSDED